jgi:hypothetical protein
LAAAVCNYLKTGGTKIYIITSCRPEEAPLAAGIFHFSRKNKRESNKQASGGSWKSDFPLFFFV